VLLYTDGVTEHRAPGTQFDEHQLGLLVRNRTDTSRAESIAPAGARHRAALAPAEQRDDIRAARGERDERLTPSNQRPAAWRRVGRSIAARVLELLFEPAEHRAEDADTCTWLTPICSCDLGLRQVLVVAEVDDLAIAVGQVAHGFTDREPHIGAREIVVDDRQARAVEHLAVVALRTGASSGDVR